MRRVLRIVAALALLGGLAACTAAPEPELVGAYGDLHVAPDGSMEFCAFDVDPGFDGPAELCFDGIETTGIDPAGLVEAPGGFVVVDSTDDRRWEGTSPRDPRRAPDGTLIHSAFLVGTIEDEVFEVTGYGTDRYTLPAEYHEPTLDEPGGFLVPVVPVPR
ncbi:hypothetical protein [Rathayibacter caricis]|uniref:hypothetical protein n=1 Tax=Rathayibacter caricis TaxID=110936 RepID=UPI0011B293AF|nr:hypothetical protein [Rathayibacter caricis]